MGPAHLPGLSFSRKRRSFSCPAPLFMSYLKEGWGPCVADNCSVSSNLAWLHSLEEIHEW